MKLTKRGRIVVALLTTLAITGIYYIATHIWWDGSGWCFGTVIECLDGNS